MAFVLFKMEKRRVFSFNFDTLEEISVYAHRYIAHAHAHAVYFTVHKKLTTQKSIISNFTIA